MAFQQVHLRINDAATGKPTPVRLRITDADGTYYAPYGRLTEFATGANQDVGGNVLIGTKAWAYIDGTCEILLPPGTLHIEIAKGPEYKPINETITLLAGKLALRFTIERWSDVRKQGWYSGDTRVHFLSADAALLEGQAEDVAVVNLLAKETTVKDSFGKPRTALPNIMSFSGQQFARQFGGCGVAVGTQNMHPVLGSLGLLHCHRVVHPLTCDTNDWTLGDWCGQCHRKKGLVIWTDPLHQTTDFLYGEPLANLILGEIDAFELTFYEDSPFDALDDYYRLLNAGFAVPLVGGSGKDSNGITLGSMRTYAQLLPNQEFSFAYWIDTIRAGRTFATNGPILNYAVNRAVDGKLFLHAEAKSIAPFEHLEWLWNGEPIATVSATSSAPYVAGLDHEFIPQESGWLAVRCRGETLLPSRPGPQRVFAHSSAIAITMADRPSRTREDALRPLLAELDKMLRWAESEKYDRFYNVVKKAREIGEQPA